MQQLLKKAQTLLDVDFRLMIDAVLDDHDLKLLSDYVRLLEKHIDTMDDMVMWSEFEARELYEQYEMFQESADIQTAERKRFEKIMKQSVGSSAHPIVIVGNSTPLDAEIADEFYEQWERESARHDEILYAVDSLQTRYEVADDIHDTILNYHEQVGTDYDDDTLFYIFDLVFEEVDRVEQEPSIDTDDTLDTYLDHIRQQLRQSRRKLRGDEY